MSPQMEAAEAIGKAALEYSADNVGALPGPGDFKKKIAPYLLANLQDAQRYAGVLDRFTWTFPGGKVADVPANKVDTTELGRYDDASGRAIVYLDLRVRQTESGR